MSEPERMIVVEKNDWKKLTDLELTCPECETTFIPDVKERIRCKHCEPVLGGKLTPKKSPPEDDWKIKDGERTRKIARKLIETEYLPKIKEEMAKEIARQRRLKVCVKCEEDFTPNSPAQKQCSTCKGDN